LFNDVSGQNLAEPFQIHPRSCYHNFRSFIQISSPRLWNQLPDSFRQPRQSCLDLPPHSLVSSSVIITTLIIHHSFTLSLQAQNYLLNKSFPPSYFHYPGLPSRSRNRTGLIVLLDLFLVRFFLILLFVPTCGGLSWLHGSFLLHVKYTISYRIVLYSI